jgi:hypothetical protein
MKTSKQILFVLCVIIVLLLSSCSGGSKTAAPEAVSAAAKNNWDYYSWSEDLGGNLWRGGGWHLVEADKNKEFSITDAVEGKVPDDLKIMMSMGMSSYSGKVWCLNFEPTLYFGYGPGSDEKLSTKNFLMFEQSQEQWVELGSVWKEPWVNFLYPPNTYKVAVNFYMGVTKSMFEMMGCSNWLE